MPASTKPSQANSGIRTDDAGSAYIPSSVRADGSTRKEIRVRPGYRPPEDVEVYKNRTAEAWKNRGKGGVPGAQPVEETQATKSKNAKRREAARQKAASEGKVADWNTFANGETGDGVQKENAQPQESGAVPEEAEKDKKARNLKKKLRQAKELQGKKEQGESLLPEQFAKVLKIQELVRDLNKLGFDENGEKKAVEEG
ncbi:putative rna binding protein [Phaeomoniella chlamydospora]|uniref:Putative rna binding protein n=1 Tax=Phaeomoniella chlamydospora TaxID=158046 RepID=A0A0G2ERH6_PHACM|nr:putative rna binding protein [Phaeomoniella chlamydospora]